MSSNELVELDELLSEYERRKRYRKIDSVFPAAGRLGRDAYPKQIAFFKAGKQFKERAFIAGNRSGKTFTVMTEVTFHATGEYPDWWEGHRFEHPVLIWCLGETNESTKDILQYELLGPYMDKGSGLIPKERIISTTNRPGVPNAVQTTVVEHRTNGIVDGNSEVIFKSYEQGRAALQGTGINFVVIDEEPGDEEVYFECLTRTLKCRICTDDNCKGRIAASFTPFNGISKVVRGFLPGGKVPEGGINPENPQKWVVNLSLRDAPHMSEEEKQAYINSIEPHMRRVRVEGLPNLGSGQVYPLLEEDISVEPFPIPTHWPRVYGMDVGWEKTAVVWFAQNPDTNIWYLYSEHYAGRMEAPLHAELIRTHGFWIPGVIDPASNRSRDDGTRLLNQYLDLGLDIRMANNSIESGISLTWQLLSCGQLKVFKTCHNWFMEQSMYHYDEKGKVPDRQPDHLLDATRYVIMSGLVLARTDPGIEDDDDDNGWFNTRGDAGASEITGY